MIRRVGQFSVGDIVLYDNQKCKIAEFPTRYSVVLKSLEHYPGGFSTAKIPLRGIKKEEKMAEAC